LTGLPTTTVIGTLTSDPQIRILNSGSSVASFTIACNDRRYNKESQQYEDGDTTFLRGSIWKQYAENVAESLRKGDKVIAVGRLRQREYEKDGQKRTSFELDVDEIGPTLRFVTAPTSRTSGGNSPKVAWGSATEEEPGW
jgi:single-strand DNA-binding protein